jgi:hypothetical protein
VLAGVVVSIYPFSGATINFGTVADPMVIKVRAGYTASIVDDAIRRALINYLTDLPASAPVTASDVYAAIIAVDGVQSAFIPVFSRASGATQTNTAPITPWPWEIFNVGSVNITFV